jgi:hypothetical protein
MADVELTEDMAPFSWKAAMQQLKFKLPLRNAQDILKAEAYLHSEEQSHLLRVVLHGVLEVSGQNRVLCMLVVFCTCCLFLLFQENIAALEDTQKAHPGAILANALLGRFDLAIATTFSYQVQLSGDR